MHDDDQVRDEQFVDQEGLPAHDDPGGGRKYTGAISWIVSGALHATVE